MSVKMEKIPVEWSDGRSKGTASLVKKSVVQEWHSYRCGESRASLGKVEENVQCKGD